jgi:hypothetical protein
MTTLKGMVGIILLHCWGERERYKLDDRKGASSSQSSCGVEEKIVGSNIQLSKSQSVT